MTKNPNDKGKVLKVDPNKKPPNFSELTRRRKEHQFDIYKRYSGLAFGAVFFIFVVTGGIFIAILGYTMTEQHTIATALLPYLTYPLSGIVGAVIGALFTRGRS